MSLFRTSSSDPALQSLPARSSVTRRSTLTLPSLVAPSSPPPDRALTYLGGHVLNEFVRDVAIKYVEDDDPDIREAAALTCCQLYVDDSIVSQTSQHALQVVGEVIEKLLTVGVSDPEPHIRRTVLAALEGRFDRHLAKAENIRTLFLALNDEVFAIREVSISIIGRLIRFNPAYIVPSLRKTLIQMLTELEFSDVARNKEESARLLSLLIQNAQGLIRPYVQPMISVLLPKANDPTPSVASTILNAIGELAAVGGEDMLPYKDKLMPLIISALQDQSSNPKREAALHALGQLASNSGYVILPYLEYPELLELLQGIIRSEGQGGRLRQETIKLMGILGALDPYKHQVFQSRLGPFLHARWATDYTDDPFYGPLFARDQVGPRPFPYRATAPALLSRPKTSLAYLGIVGPPKPIRSTNRAQRT
jgi:FKBP12-rapamycin complex-associated protein